MKEIDNGDITLGECEKMIEPLKQEIPEIIRCKDCVHYDDNRCEMHEYLHFKENDFCSYATERQEE